MRFLLFMFVVVMILASACATSKNPENWTSEELLCFLQTINDFALCVEVQREKFESLGIEWPNQFDIKEP